MNILLTGGGTAGHVNPALAIAKIIHSHRPDARFLFAASARPQDKANDLIPRAGYELKHIHIRGLQRPLFHPANLLLPAVMLRARAEARNLIRNFAPDLIIGTGGYACWPVVAEGAAQGIPTAVHESNAQPGKAICRLASCVDRVFINFPDTAERLGLPKAERGKIIQVGNPVMPEFGSIGRAEARERLGLDRDALHILAFGGSLGAEHLNDALVRLADRLVDDPTVFMTFAAGKRDIARTQAAWQAGRAGKCPRFTLTDYIYDMPVRMAAADLVISRAGAMTISELAVTGKAAVLVPSPYVADDHQLRNAEALAAAGAGVCVEERTLPDGKLEAAVMPLLADRAERRGMERRIRERFSCPDVAEVLYRELMCIIQEKGKTPDMWAEGRK